MWQSLFAGWDCQHLRDFLFKLNACGNGLLYSTYTGAAMTGRL
jgi:hypothetical protein